MSPSSLCRRASRSRSRSSRTADRRTTCTPAARASGWPRRPAPPASRPGWSQPSAGRRGRCSPAWSSARASACAGQRGGRGGGGRQGLRRQADRSADHPAVPQPARHAASIRWLPASARDRPAAPTGATPATTRLLGSSPGADASWSPHEGGERGHSGAGGASAIHVAWARPSSRSPGP